MLNLKFGGLVDGCELVGGNGGGVCVVVGVDVDVCVCEFEFERVRVCVCLCECVSGCPSVCVRVYGHTTDDHD